jgi:hypothetical protein
MHGIACDLVTYWQLLWDFCLLLRLLYGSLHWQLYYRISKGKTFVQIHGRQQQRLLFLLLLLSLLRVRPCADEASVIPRTLGKS